MDVSDELLASMSLEARSISWDMVKKESERDEQSQKLMQWINKDCPGPIGDLSDDLRQFWRLISYLRVLDGVLMYGDRTIIPQWL